MQLAIMNRKGGVGKTTTATNLAAAFAMAKDLGIGAKNYRTLLIDTDSQANASNALGIANDALEPSLTSLLLGQAQPQDVVRETSIPDLFVIPASDRIAEEIEPFIVKNPEHNGRLKQVMDIVHRPFDITIYDCPPARSPMFTMVMIAADAFIIPLPVTHFSMEGVQSMFAAYAAQRAKHPNSAALLGIVFTMMDYFTPYGHGTRADALRGRYGNAVFDTTIPKNKHLDDAQGERQTIFQFRPDSRGAEAYRAFAHEILERAKSVMLLPDTDHALAQAIA